MNPTPTLSASSSSSIICAGESATITASGANFYSWSTGESTNSIVVSPFSTTSYLLHGKNSDGCSANVVVFNQQVSPCTDILNAGYANDRITIFPNPTTGKFTILRDDNFSNMHISITDCSGRLLFIKNDLNPGAEVNLSEIAAGVLFVHLIDEDGTIFNKKLVKE
jgi:hypothetical protein